MLVSTLVNDFTKLGLNRVTIISFATGNFGSCHNNQRTNTFIVNVISKILSPVYWSLRIRGISWKLFVNILFIMIIISFNWSMINCCWLCIVHCNRRWKLLFWQEPHLPIMLKSDFVVDDFKKGRGLKRLEHQRILNNVKRQRFKFLVFSKTSLSWNIREIPIVYI